MTMRRMIAVAGMAAAVAAGSVRAHETAPPSTGKGRGGGMADRMAKRLELTAEQQAKIQQLNEAHRPLMRTKHDAQRALLKDLRGLVKAKAADGALTAKLDALKKGRLDIEAAMQAHQEAVAALLTPTQKARFVLWMSKRMDGGRLGGKGGAWRDGREGHEGGDWKDQREGHDEKGAKDDDDD